MSCVKNCFWDDIGFYFGSWRREFDIFVIKFVVGEKIISKSFGQGIIYTINC